jgi:serine/threonine protein kinase
MTEVRAAAHLRHPNVALLQDFFELSGEPWLVMKFIPGRSLIAEIADNGRLPWGRVADIGAQVADALAIQRTTRRALDNRAPTRRYTRRYRTFSAIG